MALPERVIDERRAGAQPAGEGPRAPRAPLPPVMRAIELCLPDRFRHREDEEHGHHWIFRGHNNMTARVYPNVDKDSITVTVFDDDARPRPRPEEAKGVDRPAAEAQSPPARGIAIKDWSSDLRMTGNWRRRLRRASGEALVLAQRRPRCPRCREHLILRERNDGSSQFFGCRRFPSCTGTTGIIDHDLERNKAGTTQTRGGQRVPPAHTEHVQGVDQA